MKFRFRADPQDILIFIVFAIFLLFIIALAVVNLAYLSSEGTLYGINPLPAFGPNYIGATIFFYIVSLIGLFVSVSSYFFDREDGFGLKIGKKDKGYSRWLCNRASARANREIPGTSQRVQRCLLADGR